MDKKYNIVEYLNNSGWLEQLGCRSSHDISFLASGEYNENWLISALPTHASNPASSCQRYFVFRINHGSQLGLAGKQISYEFSILDALKNSGVTPVPHFEDATAGKKDAAFDCGVLLMEYLPGTPLEYTKDIHHAAHIFASVHTQPLPADNTFIRQADPVADIVSESQELLARFADHPKTNVRCTLEKYAEKISKIGEQYSSAFMSEQQHIVNTEVNSGNFIINREKNTAHLVDWEKAVVSSRYQDLGHFLAPVTTLWKTDFLATPEHKRNFLTHYKKQSGIQQTLEELTTLTTVLEKTIILRGLSWCYMAWYEYTQQNRSIKNNDTFATIERYLDNIEWFLQ